MSNHLKPGPALDRLVAEKVMGFKVEMCGIHHQYECCGLRIPEYSTNIRDAWMVVEKVGVNGCRISKYIDGRYSCEFGIPKIKFSYAISETVPHAICLAALRAVGGGQ